MPLAILYSRGRTGVEAPLVTVEVHVTNGLPSLSIVGLPEAAVKESKDRVRGAIINSQLNFPVQRITVNLAPADLPKEGGRFDLAIALGILAASGQLPHPILEQYEFVGELSLSGALRPISGILPVSLACKNAKKKLILPLENQEEAQLVKQATNLAAASLLDVCAHLHGQKPIEAQQYCSQQAPSIRTSPDFADVHGHFHAKRAFEIAATGQHNLLLYGPPGTGKSMLAACLPSILPSLTEEQALESAAITSISNNKTNQHDWLTPPFRSPHHSASATALVGGGSNPKPGEISLAHHGVLFLDELPEFDKKALEVLREPLETGIITISRANKQSDFPSRFQLIAAMNPCPCGYLGDPLGRCQCTTDQVNRYGIKYLHRYWIELIFTWKSLALNLSCCARAIRKVKKTAQRLNNALMLPAISLYRVRVRPMPFSPPPTLKPFAPYPNQTIKYWNKPLTVSDCLTGAITESLSYPVPSPISITLKPLNRII